MTDRLRAARQRGLDLKLEDFVGTHLLEGVYERQMMYSHDDYYGRTVEIPSTMLRLDGLYYGFQPDDSLGRSGLKRIRVIPHITPAPTLELVVEIYSHLDVIEQPSELCAEMIYVTSEQHEGRIVLELGDELHINVSRNRSAPHRKEFLSRWYPNGLTEWPAYLERRDPEEPMPTEIAKREKAYTPKRNGWGQRGSGKQRRG